MTNTLSTTNSGKVSELTLKRVRGFVRKRDDGSIPNIVLRIAGKNIKELRPYTKLNTETPAFKFRFHQSLAQYIRDVNDIQFLVDGNVLPVEYADIPVRKKSKHIDELIEKISGNFFISKKGEVLKSLRDDIEWQDSVFSFYDYARAKFKALFGYDLYITYGTLLGLEREQNFIVGDDDFDTAYLSKHSRPDLIKAEFRKIVSTLSASGEKISIPRGNLIQWKGKNGEKIDVFISWIQDRDYYLTFAVGGPYAGLFEDGFEEVEFVGRSVLAPVRRREYVEAIYGSGWRTPDPLFQWRVQPKARKVMNKVKLTELERVKEHWSNFYGSDKAPPQPSDFATFVASKLPENIRYVVDFGCGNGRDTETVGNGRMALGVDYSKSAIEYNRARAKPNTSFEQVDASSAKSLDMGLSKFVSSQPIAFYSRFVVHAISDDAEKLLLKFLKRNLKPKSILFLEFRTNQDSDTRKAFGEHFRRYVDPDLFLERVRKGGQFKVVYDKRGHGMAVYKDEDPHVCRLIIKRRGDFSRYVYRAFEKLSEMLSR